jgi:hypothetical protein
MCESQNTQPLEVCFRALVTEGDVQTHTQLK